MFIGNIKHDATITKLKVICVPLATHSRIFLVGGSSISTARTTVRNWTASLKFHRLELPRKCRCRRKAFRSITQWSQTRVLHVVDLFVFFGILASFLDWISLSVTVSDPSSRIFFTCKQVSRKILGAKIEIVNCLLVVCTQRFKIVFRKLNSSTASKAALVWVINGSTSDSESFDTARIFRLFLAFTTNN